MKAAPVRDAADPAIHARPKILVVDDHAPNLVALEAVLGSLAVEVVRARSGEEALKFLLHDPFAAIVLDVQMPGLDGYQTASLIRGRKRCEHIPILFVTAVHGEPHEVFKGYEHGAVDYLVKPFDGDVLRSKIRFFVDLYQREEELLRQEAELRERQSDQHSRDLERQFRALTEAMPLGVSAAKLDGTVYFRNRAWSAYTGLPADPEEGTNWTERAHPDEVEEARGVWRAALDTGEPFDRSFRLRRVSDGEYRWHLVRGVPGLDEQGRRTSWIATFVDVHDSTLAREDAQRARREAEDANRMKDDFLATVSHELRTPLTAILGWTQIMRTTELPAEKVRRALETIERNARAQIEMVEDILDVSRITAGRLRLEARGHDLVEIAGEAIESARPAADAKRLVLELRSDGHGEPVFGDRGRLLQIVTNLLTNAIKFTPASGSIEVILSSQADRAVLRVRDNGQGIEPEALPQIFERFRQVDRSNRRARLGLGLGLSLVRDFVEMQGGTIEVESPGLGLGATFTVLLPRGPITRIARSAETAETAGPQVPQGEALRGLRILLVEDEVDVRDLVMELLTGCGGQVSGAASAEEAIGLVPRVRPHVILSDLGLPGADGYELLRQVRRLPADAGGATPAAALTAYASQEEAERVLAAGFQRHLRKPVHAVDLVRAVQELASSTGAAAAAGAASAAEATSSAAATRSPS